MASKVIVVYQDVDVVNFMNRVSEALKGRKVNQACQAWMGWMPLALWYGALSRSLSLVLIL